MKNKENSIVLTIFGIFFGVGIISFFIGALASIMILNYSNKTVTNGTISRISEKMVFVKYYVDDKQIESRLSGYSSTFNEGDNIEIYYDNNDPRVIGNKGLDLIVLIAPGIGMVFLLIGGIGLFVISKKQSNKIKLKQTGERITAKLASVERNFNIRVANKHPYYLVCEWNNPEDGLKYIFKSASIWFDPGKLIEEKNITEIPVYIDKDNKKKYYVDVSEIENSVVDLS